MSEGVERGRSAIASANAREEYQEKTTCERGIPVSQVVFSAIGSPVIDSIQPTLFDSIYAKGIT